MLLKYNIANVVLSGLVRQMHYFNLYLKNPLFKTQSKLLLIAYPQSKIGLTHPMKETWFLAVNFLTKSYISLSETRFLRQS